MRASKAFAAAGLAALTTPAMACDLEAFGDVRFSDFGGMHTGGQQAPDPAPTPTSSEEQGGTGSDDQPSGEQSSGGSDAPVEGSGGTAEPSSNGQGDAATFR